MMMQIPTPKKKSRTSTLAQSSGKYAKSADNTRQKLMRAAVELFAKQGFDAASVKDISEKAGVNISLVSYYFKGKVGLYRACLEEAADEKTDVIGKILSPPSTASEFKVRLEMMVHTLLISHLENPHLGCMLHRDIDLDIPIAHEIFEKKFLPIVGLVFEFFESAKKKLIIRKSASSDILCALLFGMITHMMRSDSIHKRHLKVSLSDREFRDRVVNQMVQLFQEGVVINGSRPT